MDTSGTNKSDREHPLATEGFQVLLDTLPAYIAVLSVEEFRYLFINQCYAKSFRLPRERIVGMTVKELIGERGWEKSRPNLERAKAGQAASYENSFELHDGTHWLSVNHLPQVGPDGRVERIVVFAYDISGKKHAEEVLRASEARYQMVFENTGTANAIFDVDCRLVLQNRMSIEYLGKKPEEVRGRLVSEILGPAGPIVMERMKRVMRTRVPESFETEFSLPVGKKVTHTAYQPLTDHDGKLQGIQVISQDITARRNAEEEVRRANESLKQHRDQLRAMASALTMAEQKERARLAQLLHGDHQQLLVAAALHLGQLSTSTDPRARKVGAELGDLLRQAIESARSLSRELGPPILHEAGFVPAVEWLCDWTEKKSGLKTALSVDPEAVPASDDLASFLFQSIKELLVNVAKHSKVMTAQVEVRRSGERVRVVVADQGVGFDSAASPGPVSGTGFGLFAMRERLVMLGGDMGVESRPGDGTRVVLTVPAKPLALLPASERSAKEAGPTPISGSSGRIRVLVAEDHAVVRRGLVRVLVEDQGIEVVGEASDGKQAVDLARSLRPDVITMDISMPVLGGLEATRIIRSELPEVRIIGLSMFDDHERAEAMKEAGAFAYLSKSVPPAELLAAIHASIVREAKPGVAKGRKEPRPRRAARAKSARRTPGRS